MNALAKSGQTDLSPAARQKARLEGFMSQVASRAEQFGTLLADSKIDPKLFIETCRRAIMRDPEMLESDPATFIQSAMNCAADGLIPDGRKAAFVRYYDNRAGKSNVQYIPMYQGLLDIAYRSCNFQSIEGQVVYKGDEFDFRLGDDPFIHHTRSIEAETTEIIGAYAVARTVNGGVFREVVGKKDLAQIRAVSRAKKGPNVDWPGEMARKAAVRRLWKFLPRTPAMDSVMAHDERNYDLDAPAVVPVQHRLHAGFQATITDARDETIDVTPTVAETVEDPAAEEALRDTFHAEEVEAAVQAAPKAAAKTIEGVELKTGAQLQAEQTRKPEPLPADAQKVLDRLKADLTGADNEATLADVWARASEFRGGLADHSPTEADKLSDLFNARYEELTA